MSVRIKTPLLNRSKVRQFALKMAEQRVHQLTRVGDPFYQRCETNLKAYIRAYIHGLPSKGKTIL